MNVNIDEHIIKQFWKHFKLVAKLFYFKVTVRYVKNIRSVKQSNNLLLMWLKQ